MNFKSTLKVEGYFEFSVLIILIATFLYLIKSFILPIFLAAIFVFLTRNFYLKILEKTKNKYISSVIVILLVISVIVFPLYILSVEMIKQLYMTLNGTFNSGINLNSCHYHFCDQIKSNIGVLNLSFDRIFNSIILFVKNSYSSIFDSISKILLDLFIFILAYYYLLIDGEKFMRYIRRIIPMRTEYKNALFMKFKNISEVIFFNTLLIAFIQGTLVGIGFYIFGVSSPILWGLVASFFALIPMVGTSVVWFPEVVYMFLVNEYLKGFLLLLYGALFVGLSDNFLRPLLLKKRINVHPFLILISVLGGLQLFGFFGLFIGPIITAFLISVIQLYKLDFN